MTSRPRSFTRDTVALQDILTTDHEPLLPTHSDSSASKSPSWSVRNAIRTFRRRRSLLVFTFLLTLLLLNWTSLSTWRRDFGYLLRPIWDKPPKAFTLIPHYAPPTLSSGEVDTSKWCGLHGWTPRGGKPTIVDAVLFNTELDLLEIRMKEYRGIVDIFVIIESDRTFSGAPKVAHYEANYKRFERILMGTGSKVVHRKVDLLPDRPKGSFENEYKMRVVVGEVLNSLRLSPGSLIINSDVDEIVSRQTLELLETCNVPKDLHLNVKNYRYGFNFPIPDTGYWRPHIGVVGAGPVSYGHGRVGDVMLENAGWHCTFCFATVGEMRAKMIGYSHNDRIGNGRVARVESIRRRMCEGREPFNMFPEAFTFKDLIAQSGALQESLDFTDIPLAVREDPDRFAYLLEKGCDRPVE